MRAITRAAGPASSRGGSGGRAGVAARARWGAEGLADAGDYTRGGVRQLAGGERRGVRVAGAEVELAHLLPPLRARRPAISVDAGAYRSREERGNKGTGGGRLCHERGRATVIASGAKQSLRLRWLDSRCPRLLRRPLRGLLATTEVLTPVP